MKKYRHLFTISVLFSVIFLPYWIYLPLIVIGAVMVPFYWEVIFLSLLADSLYGELGFAPHTLIQSFSFWTLLLLVSLVPLKKIIRNYA